MRPSPLQAFNAQEPPSRPSTEPTGVPEEVQRCLSAGGEDQPITDVREYFDLGMALAKMHYQDREAEIKKMNSTQLQTCSDAVDFFYNHWDNKMQSEKNVLLSSKRCTNDDENNIRFLGRPDMRMDFKTIVARVFEHAKPVRIGGRKARPSKIDTASLQGTDSQKTTPTVTPSGGASITSRRHSLGGTPTDNSSSTPSMGNTPTGRQPSPEAAASSLLPMPPRNKSSPLLLKRSTGSLKKNKAKEGSSAEMRKAEGDGAAAAAPGEAQLKRSSGSFKESDSTNKSTTISPHGGALKRSSGSFKLGAAAPFVKTESLTGASPQNKAASSPTGKAKKNVEFLM
jgi:hypothetical protein